MPTPLDFWFFLRILWIFIFSLFGITSITMAPCAKCEYKGKVKTSENKTKVCDRCKNMEAMEVESTQVDGVVGGDVPDILNTQVNVEAAADTAAKLLR